MSRRTTPYVMRHHFFVLFSGSLYLLPDCPAYFYCICMHVCVCCLPPALCITPGINQSSLLVICRLHFPACRGAKCLCKPLWEINTINTARFNSPQAHNIFKYLSTVLPPSSPISLSCLCSFCCFSLLFRCATIPLFDIFCFTRPLFVSYLCLALSSFCSS